MHKVIHGSIIYNCKDYMMPKCRRLDIHSRALLFYPSVYNTPAQHSGLKIQLIIHDSMSGLGSAGWFFPYTCYRLRSLS